MKIVDIIAKHKRLLEIRMMRVKEEHIVKNLCLRRREFKVRGRLVAKDSLLTTILEIPQNKWTTMNNMM